MGGGYAPTQVFLGPIVHAQGVVGVKVPAWPRRPHGVTNQFNPDHHALADIGKAADGWGKESQ